MSLIQASLLKLLDIDGPEKAEDRQSFLKRVVKAINELTDKEFEKLSKEAAEWFNELCDVLDANKKAKNDDDKKPLPDFPDFKAPAEASGGKRRRSSDEDEDAGTPSAAKVGMQVTVITQKGREYKGEVVEKDDKIIVVKQASGEEVEIDMERVGTIEIKNDGKAGDEPAGEAAMGPGANVKLTTKRGREVTGEVVSIDDEEIVLKLEDGTEEDFLQSRVEDIKVLSGGKKAPAAKAEEAGSTRRRGAGDDKPAAADEKGKKTTKAENGGVSIGQRIKELIVENLDADQAGIAKILTKEGLNFNDNTLKLTFVETHKVVSLLKAAKLLKG